MTIIDYMKTAYFWVPIAVFIVLIIELWRTERKRESYYENYEEYEHYGLGDEKDEVSDGR